MEKKYFESKTWVLSTGILYIAAFVNLLIAQFPLRHDTRHYFLLGLTILCIVLKLFDIIRAIKGSDKKRYKL